MRMWMVDVRMMCDKHLLGEHLELHMFATAIQRHPQSLAGYLQNNLLEPGSIFTRHDEIVKEMAQRGMNHQSELIPFEIPENLLARKIDRAAALWILRGRCTRCNSAFNSAEGHKP